MQDLGDYSDMDPYGSDLGEDEGGGDDKPSSHLTGFIDIDDKTVDKVLGKFAGSMHVFLELFADWCSACQQLKPELEEVAQEYGDHPTLLLAKADAQSNPLISARFNVTAFPTIKFRRKGSSTWEEYVVRLHWLSCVLSYFRTHYALFLVVLSFLGTCDDIHCCYDLQL